MIRNEELVKAQHKPLLISMMPGLGESNNKIPMVQGELTMITMQPLSIVDDNNYIF